MSEPTPLSAERALNLLRMAARVDPLLRQAVADVELHIDAQATEIAALKGALEAVIPWFSGEARDRAYRLALLRYNDSEGGGTETDVLNELERQREVAFRAARVLAGKEARNEQ